MRCGSLAPFGASSWSWSASSLRSRERSARSSAS